MHGYAERPMARTRRHRSTGRSPSPYRQPRSRALPALVAAAAGLIALGSVFLPWYRTNLGEPDTVGNASGWEATGIGKAVVALAVIWIIAAAFAASDDFGTVRLDVRTIEGLGYLVAACAVLAGLLVVDRIVHPPGPTPDFLSRDYGLVVAGLACIAGAVAGAAMAARR